VICEKGGSRQVSKTDVILFRVPLAHCISHSYPKVNIKISSISKLPVADLKTDSHDIVLVQLLVEAFPAVGWKLYVVAYHGMEEADRR
jgi:hypothetical protein